MVYIKMPDKIRVVFDCSAECGGVSVNKSITSTLDLTNQIICILVRIRKFFIKSLQSFPWYKNGNINKQPQYYHTNADFFGGASSPDCTNYLLQITARHQEARYGKEVANAKMSM